jgi:alpha-tubulin suppressor-like RCC1 family protein
LPPAAGQVLARDEGVVVLQANGDLWTWGRNKPPKRFGSGYCTATIHPRPVQVGTDVVQATLGRGFLVAMKKDGSVWTWGWPWDGDQM